MSVTKKRRRWIRRAAQRKQAPVIHRTTDPYGNHATNPNAQMKMRDGLRHLRRWWERNGGN